MQKLVLGSLAAILLGGTALAADLPVRSEPPAYAPVPPVFTWTGFYVGVNAGGVFTDNSIRTMGTAANTIDNVTFARRPASISSRESGFTGGGQIGYNYQIDNFVLGVEADINFADLNKRSAFVGTTGATSIFNHDTSYIGTVRLRAGYAIDRLLIYATGGLAYGDVRNSAVFFNAAVPGQIDYIGRRSGTQAGYAVGGGLEYAITNEISVKAEYLYYDLGRKNVAVALTPAGPAGGAYVSRFDNSGHIVRAGLNYRFSTY